MSARPCTARSLPQRLARPGCWVAGATTQRVVARNRRWAPVHDGARSPHVAASREQEAAEADEETSTSGRSHLWPSMVGAAAAPCVRTGAAAAASAIAVLLPACVAHAGETAPDGFLEFIITSIEALGPWGPAAFVSTVAIAECIPLFPTQPLALASGLLFGTQKGALCVLSGANLAALLAFLIARGIGRPLAERIINHELSGGGSGGEGSEPGLVQKKLAEVQAVIERGSFWQQAGAVLLLRMTPVVPFSASNYVLGLSPLPLAPYLAGTAMGMTFWSLFYASLGGASRNLLRRGVDPDVLLADLVDKAGEYTRELVVGGAVLAAGALLVLGVAVARRRLADAGVLGASPGDQGSTCKLTLGGNNGAAAAAAEDMAQRSSSVAAASSSNGATAGSNCAATTSANGAGASSQGLVGDRLREWLGPSSVVPQGEELVRSRVKD